MDISSVYFHRQNIKGESIKSIKAMLDRIILLFFALIFLIFSLILLQFVKKFIYSKPPGRRLVSDFLRQVLHIAKTP